MTREEARNLLKNSKPEGSNAYSLMLNDALDMAIEALEQELCEDIVSRKAVFDALESIGSLDTEADREYARSVFEELPPVTPQPRTGHWICTLEDWNKWECSECGFTKRTDVHVNIGYKYCPGCGAKMESEAKK